MRKLIVALLAIVSAILYRMGGSGNYPRQVRVIGVPFLILLSTWLLLGWHTQFIWAFPVMFGLAIGAISTYWDFLFSFDNFYFYGFMLGLTALPLIGIVSWLVILLRAVVLAVTFGVLNWYVNKKQIPHSDIIEECSRGALLILTLFLFLI